MTLLRSFNDGNRLWRWICAIGFEERTVCIPAKGLNRGAVFQGSYNNEDYSI